MSKIAFTPNASGTGTFSIASPGTNTDRTLTLPDATGTVNVSGLANEVPAGSAGAPAIYPTGDSNTGMFFPAADTIAFAEGGIEVARIDTRGNLGLGVTPSAWGITWRALELAGGSLSVASFTDVLVTQNAHNNGTNWIYRNTGFASTYAQAAGQHRFFTAPSGTAGNTVTFTQAMTLDASGRLLLGTTSAPATASMLTLSAPASTLYGTFNAAAQTFSYLAMQTSGTDFGYIGPGALDLPSSMSIAAAGARSLTFGTNGTERARIDSSGNLLVGTTSTIGTGARVQAAAPQFTDVMALQTNTTALQGIVRFYNPNGAVGNINTNGSATAYVTSSDYRLKENVQPMQDALAKIAQLNPVTYTWRVDGSDGQGFIAHELQAVVPDCVSGEKDAVDAEGNPQYQGVDTSFLVATLVKAVQELTARVAALEAN